MLDVLGTTSRQETLKVALDFARQIPHGHDYYFICYSPPVTARDKFKDLATHPQICPSRSSTDAATGGEPLLLVRGKKFVKAISPPMFPVVNYSLSE